MGSAALSSSTPAAYTLTSPVASVGAVFTAQTYAVVDSFQASFVATVSTSGSSTGDGFAFVLQMGNTGLIAAGPAGPSYGFAGTGLAIIFSAYGINEISLGMNGNTLPVNGAIFAPPSGFNDGKTHTVQVTYDSVDATMFVYIDGVIQAIVPSLNLQNLLTTSSNKGYGLIGFTGSNGVNGLSVFSIGSLSLTVAQTSVANSTITPTTALTATDTTFTLTAGTNCGFPRTVGGDTITLKFTNSITGTTVTPSSGPVDQNNGMYTYIVNFPVIGSYSVSATLGAVTATLGSTITVA
eukprot:TRINITY_DN47517_c0_g2_i1.p1 TRINITY_DN47517_c0_g2~~TRINITY_DN47517_c0_g2_i1.p1  ORF type:complete len:336 (+),score=65.75 TRINITY_DN47517_c0_g2_i1:125-1009(+)